VAARARHDDRSPLAGRRRIRDTVENPRYRLDPQYHAWTTAERRIVSALTLAKFVEQMMVVHVCYAALDGAPDD
jgi:hypothetical protein